MFVVRVHVGEPEPTVIVNRQIRNALSCRQNMAQRQAFKLVTFEPPSCYRSFLKEHRSASSPRTVAFYQDQLPPFLDFLKDRAVRDLRDITPEHLRDYMAMQAEIVSERTGKPLSAWSRVHRYRSVKRFLNWCVEQDYLDTSPMAKLKQPRLVLATREAFTNDEVQDMHDVLATKPGWLGQRDRALFAVALGTGGRAVEICTMQPHDIDWTHRRITFHGKGQKDRRVPMGKSVFRALRDYLAVRPESRHRGIWITQRGDEFTYSAFEMMMRSLGRYAGVDNATIHRCRHTFATTFYLQNRDILGLKACLGHSNVEVTMRYLQRLGVDYGVEGKFRMPGD